MVNNSDILVRNFQWSDLPFLTELTNELGYPSTLEQMEIRMEIIVPLDTYWTFVAVTGKEIVGYIGFDKNYFWEQDGFFIKIQALVVKREFRRLGIGRKLMDSVEQFSRKMKAKSIILNSGNRTERQSAHQFYPQMGFEAKSTGYSKKLE